MSANQAGFPIAAMARVLGVSKAGYYAWLHRPASGHAMADAALLKRVRTIHVSSRHTYGAPRIHADLRQRGERHSRKRIARLMREAGLVGASHRRGGPVTTRRDKDARPAPDPGLRRGRLWSTVTSARPSRTSCGSPILPMCRQQQDFSIWPLCSTPGAARSSVGRWRTTCAPSWCWTRWQWRLASGGQRTSFTTATRAASIRQWHSASGAVKPVFGPRWDRSAMPMTTPWPRVSFHPRGRTPQPSPVRISSRGQDGLLHLYRGSVQSSPVAFRSRIQVANSLRSRHAGRHDRKLNC
jgi:hypothetical protein